MGYPCRSVAAAAAMFLAPPLFGQGEIDAVLGAAGGGKFGAALARLGDLDGDGVEDFAVGSSGIPRVGVYSGATRALLVQYVPSALELEFGAALANAGDTDADGAPDLLIGIPGDNSTFQHLGAALWIGGAGGAPLKLFGKKASSRFGAAVAGAGDVDGDGFDEFLVGAPQFVTAAAGAAGRTDLISGQSRLVLQAYLGQSFGEELGAALASADFDGDGATDVALGGPGYTAPGAYATGIVRVLRAASGAPLGARSGTASYERLGETLAAFADWNGDGAAELWIGAPGHASLYGAPGRAELWSPALDSVLAVLSAGAPGDQFGAELALAGDLDGDGRADVLAAARRSFGLLPVPSGAVHAFSGATLAPLFAVHAANPTDDYGSALAGLGDLDADGRAEFAVGARLEDDGHVVDGGAVHVATHSGCGTFALYGSGCPLPGGGVPLLYAKGCAAAGAGVAIHLSNAFGAGAALLLAAAAPSAVPAGGSCVLLLAAPWLTAAPVPIGTWTPGGIAVPAEVPPGLSGSTVYLQAAVSSSPSPGAGALSNGLRIELQ